MPDEKRNAVAMDTPPLGICPDCAEAMLNGVELQSYNWSPGATTSYFWLQWQVLWEGESDTHFYVHLVDAAGTQLGQRDGAGFATASRKVGDRVITLFDITLDPQHKGEALWARVGMYTFPDLVGIPVIDAGGNPMTADVSLGPLHRQSNSE